MDIVGLGFHVLRGRFSIDGILYSLYSYGMKDIRISDSKGVEEARKALPAILDAAAQGRTTIITRHGNAVAAVVPAKSAAAAKPATLLALAGSGKGLWGRNSAATVARLREEWSR